MKNACSLDEWPSSRRCVVLLELCLDVHSIRGWAHNGARSPVLKIHCVPLAEYSWNLFTTAVVSFFHFTIFWFIVSPLQRTLHPGLKTGLPRQMKRSRGISVHHWNWIQSDTEVLFIYCSLVAFGLMMVKSFVYSNAEECAFSASWIIARDPIQRKVALNSWVTSLAGNRMNRDNHRELSSLWNVQIVRLQG